MLKMFQNKNCPLHFFVFTVNVNVFKILFKFLCDVYLLGLQKKVVTVLTSRRIQILLELVRNKFYSSRHLNILSVDRSICHIID